MPKIKTLCIFHLQYRTETFAGSVLAKVTEKKHATLDYFWDWQTSQIQQIEKDGGEKTIVVGAQIIWPK